ncbi:hypothetical protein V8C26DRAFT_411518 [Trichoderma gracile]
MKPCDEKLFRFPPDFTIQPFVLSSSPSPLLTSTSLTFVIISSSTFKTERAGMIQITARGEGHQQLALSRGAGSTSTWLGASLRRHVCVCQPFVCECGYI